MHAAIESATIAKRRMHERDTLSLYLDARRAGHACGARAAVERLSGLLRIIHVKHSRPPAPPGSELPEIPWDLPAPPARIERATNGLGNACWGIRGKMGFRLFSLC